MTDMEVLRLVAEKHDLSIEAARAHDDGQSSRLIASNGASTVVSSQWDEDHAAHIAAVIDRYATTGSFYERPTE